MAGNSTFRGIVFCNLGTPNELFQISSPRGKLRPHIFPHMVTPTMFPVDKKASSRQKSLSHKCINSLVSHKLSHSVFFGGGRLRVPTRRCDLVVPADWGWVQQMNQVANRFTNQPNEWIWMLCFQTTFHKSTMLCSLITATSGSAWY